MKLRSLLAALSLGLSICTGALAQAPAPAAPAPAAPVPAAVPAADPAADPATEDLKALIGRISLKAREGQATAETLAPEIAEFDQLLAKYPGKGEATATIAIMKALLYVQVLNDAAKARELLLEVKKNYPDTEPGRAVDQLIARIDESAQKAEAKAALVGKAAPELHFKWSSKDGLKTLSSLKGQVVVLDFWATWCGPCLASFPQIRTEVARFKGSPVTFVGVTSIQGFVANMGERIDTEGDPAKEIGLLPQFMKAKDMTWDVAVSEEEVFNPAYGIEGIPYLAIIAPDGTVRHAGLHPGDPASDVAGKVEAILKEFNLPLPAKS